MLTIKAACYKYLLDIRKTIEKYLLTVEGKIFFNMILFSVKLSTRFESKTKDWNFLKWLLDYILLACPQKIYYYIVPTGLPRWYSGKKICLAIQETQRHGFSSLVQEDALEKGMAIHSSIFCLGIPWTEEPGRLQSLGLGWRNCRWSSNTLATWCEELTHWKRSWCWKRLRARGEGVNKGWDAGWHHWLNGHECEQIPRDSEGQGSLVCCSPWSCKELDTT